MYVLTIMIVIILISFSGLFSGLTLGLLGLDKTELERKIKLGDKKAKRVYSVRKNGNFLLCTLLLGNVAVNSALAIFLGSITSGILAGITATGLIVIFGEIIPQATISRYALTIGSHTIWIVRMFMVILYPICWPLSKTLDKILGEEMPTIWSRKELAEIIKLHEDSKDSSIDSDEERIMLGALSYSKKTVKDIMTPRTVVFALEIDTLIDKKILNKIRKSGFTRIPIYKENHDNILGILYAKDLIGISRGKKIKDIYKTKSLMKVPVTKRLDILLNEFIKKKAHMACVFDEYGIFEGIVSIEDIIEEILKVEIVDEDDIVADLQKLAKDKAKNNLTKK